MRTVVALNNKKEGDVLHRVSFYVWEHPGAEDLIVDGVAEAIRDGRGIIGEVIDDAADHIETEVVEESLEVDR